MFRRFARVAALVAAGIAAPAMAQFSDNFDSYQVGPSCDQGGWKGWDDNDNACGVISDEQANSPGNSMKIIGSEGPLGDDAVHEFVGIEGGKWVFIVNTYVPSGATGAGFIILLNTYSDGGDKNWSLQVGVDADFGEIQDDPINIVPPVDTLPLILDEWVEFRAEIDFDADTVDYFYNNEQFVEDKSWIDGVTGGGQPRVQAIDLYANEPPIGSSGMYFDDVSLQPAGGGCFPDCDENGALNILDFVCYQGKFQAGDPGADCDGNGMLNILDFVCFQGEFQAGCP
jgi:hypothetical protein